MPRRFDVIAMATCNRPRASAIALTVGALVFVGAGCPAHDAGTAPGSGGGTARAGGSSGQSGGGGGGGTSATGGGAGATAAGTGGAGATGAGGAGPFLGCAAAGLLFCDDFESAPLGAPPPAPKWSTSFNGAATITVDGATPAHSGTRSVHVQTTGAFQAFFVLSDAVTFPSRAYFRTYIRLGAPMTTGHNTYFKSGAAATPSSDHETRVGVMNAMLIINQPAGDRGFMSNRNFYNDGGKPGVVFQPLAWTCVEVMVDPPHSEIDVWVDGEEVPDLHVTDWQQDPVGALRFGFEKYAGPDADIWYDDIAVASRPIGCR